MRTGTNEVLLSGKSAMGAESAGAPPVTIEDPGDSDLLILNAHNVKITMTNLYI